MLEIINQVLYSISLVVVLFFCGFVAIYLGKQVFIGFIYEFKTRRYIKKKYPKHHIDYLCYEVFEDSVLCELNKKEYEVGNRLFGSLKFKNKKIIDELKFYQHT